MSVSADHKQDHRTLEAQCVRIILQGDILNRVQQIISTYPCIMGGKKREKNIIHSGLYA